MLVGIITLIISAIVVFNHQLVWLLAVFPGLYVAYAFFIAFSKAPELKDSIHLTHSEKEVWQQYHAFFRFPFAARSMAGTLAMLQVVSVILAVALAATGAYWGLAFALGWFILGLPTPRLNPAPYIDAAQRGDHEAIKRVQALESLQNKLNNPDKQSGNHTKHTPTKPVKTQERQKRTANTFSVKTEANQPHPILFVREEAKAAYDDLMKIAKRLKDEQPSQDKSKFYREVVAIYLDDGSFLPAEVVGFAKGHAGHYKREVGLTDIVYSLLLERRGLADELFPDEEGEKTIDAIMKAIKALPKDDIKAIPEYYAESVVMTADSAIKELDDRIEYAKEQLINSTIRLVAINMMVLKRRLKRSDSSSDAQNKVLSKTIMEVISSLANHLSISRDDASKQLKVELATFSNELKTFMTSSLLGDEVDELTKIKFIKSVDKAVANNKEVSTHLDVNSAVNEMISLAQTRELPS